MMTPLPLVKRSGALPPSPTAPRRRFPASPRNPLVCFSLSLSHITDQSQDGLAPHPMIPTTHRPTPPHLPPPRLPPTMTLTTPVWEVMFTSTARPSPVTIRCFVGTASLTCSTAPAMPTQSTSKGSSFTRRCGSTILLSKTSPPSYTTPSIILRMFIRTGYPTVSSFTADEVPHCAALVSVYLMWRHSPECS
ncbi:hypothetical protein KSP40_PGU005654 [Platanthera guangdongensis]|uniref:Uncharacterized protein n=1 Tax=Platanthera guangdongensis TaxID=2320717 RepID=A0ABR2LCU5_9ASPA